MPLLDINWRPSAKELRVFAGLLLIFALVVAGLTGLQSRLGSGIAVLGTLASLVGLVWPNALRPLYVVWMVAVFPIGWVVSHTLMAIVYYAVVTPIGLAMRMVGYDPMQRKWDPQARSYWQPRRDPPETRRYFRPF